MGKLEGKVALITGAGSGIGRASALRFAADGAAVMCADLDLEGAQHTAAQVAERGGGSASALKLDVSDRAAVEASLEKTISELGGLDVIFNNAGISGIAINEDGTMRSLGWDRVIDVNLTGVYNGLFYGCQLLAARGGGAVVSTASIAGLVGLVPPPIAGDQPPPEYGAGSYAAAKGAVVQMTRQFAVTYASRGVRVNAVAPGYIVTPMTEFARADPAYEAFLAGLHPLGRLGQPEEIAAAAAFLASDDASFITGVTIAVDGGYTAR